MLEVAVAWLTGSKSARGPSGLAEGSNAPIRNLVPSTFSHPNAWAMVMQNRFGRYLFIVGMHGTPERGWRAVEAAREAWSWRQLHGTTASAN